MVKFLILGVWACVVSLGAAFGVMTWQKGRTSQVAKPEAPKYSTLRTRTISVPMLLDGRVKGYVIARFEVTANAGKLGQAATSAESIVSDEAFKLIYSRSPRDLQTAQKHDLQALTATILEGVNKRLGEDVAKDVVIESWSYLSKEDVDKLNEKSQ